MEVKQNIITSYKTTDRFVPQFTLHWEYRTIILDNVIYQCYKYNPQCTFQIQYQKHKYEVTNSLSQHPTSYHHSPHMRVIVPEHKTRFAIPNIVLRETCLSSRSLPSKPDTCDRQRCSILPKCPNGNGTATEGVSNRYPLKTR